MAFLELTKAGDLPTFCNVHAAVGKGCPNRRDDVLLVQYLLKAVYESFCPPGASMPSPAGPLVVDGFAGENTYTYITHFQQSINYSGGSVRMDGRVDRAQGFTGAVTGCVYTIIHMNHAYDVGRPADSGRLWLAADCPNELQKNLIAASKASGGGPSIIETQGGGV